MCMDCARVAVASAPVVGVLASKLRIRAAYTLLGKRLLITGNRWIVNGVTGPTRWHVATIAFDMGEPTQWRGGFRREPNKKDSRRSADRRARRWTH